MSKFLSLYTFASHLLTGMLPQTIFVNDPSKNIFGSTVLKKTFEVEMYSMPASVRLR